MAQTWTDMQEMTNEVFKYIFATEAVLKLLGFGIKEYFKSRWNTGDFFIVVLSFMSLNTSFLRLLRITRVRLRQEGEPELPRAPSAGCSGNE